MGTAAGPFCASTKHASSAHAVPPKISAGAERVMRALPPAGAGIVWTKTPSLQVCAEASRAIPTESVAAMVPTATRLTLRVERRPRIHTSVRRILSRHRMATAGFSAGGRLAEVGRALLD